MHKKAKPDVKTQRFSVFMTPFSTEVIRKKNANSASYKGVMKTPKRRFLSFSF